MISNPLGVGHYVERHEPGQSLLNLKFDKLQHFDTVHIDKGQAEYATTVETVSLKKKDYDCYEDNSMKMSECLDEFIAEEMECNLPWAKEHSTKAMDVCSGAEKLSTFRNISFYITTEKYKDAIQEKGCFKPNCKKRRWERKYFEMFPSWVKNHTIIMQGLSDSATTILRKEIRLADFSTFIADCGSYLGLFLGASILSLSDIAISAAKKANKIMKWKRMSQSSLSLK